MPQKVFDVFCIVIVFLAILMSGIFYTIAYTLKYIVVGDNIRGRIIFFLLYCIYFYLMLFHRALFLLITMIWLYYEVFTSCKATVEVIKKRQ